MFSLLTKIKHLFDHTEPPKETFNVANTGGEFGMVYVSVGNTQVELDNIFHYKGIIIGNKETADEFLARGLRVHPTHPDEMAIKGETVYPIFQKDGKTVISETGFSKGDYVFSPNYKPDWVDIGEEPRKFEAIKKMCVEKLGEMPRTIQGAFNDPEVCKWVREKQVLAYMDFNLWGRSRISEIFQAEESAKLMRSYVMN